MNWSEWERQYKIIKESLNLTFEKDYEAAQVLNEKLSSFDVENIIENIKNLIYDKTCYIFGCGPSLENNIVKIKDKINDQITIIAADGATTALLNNGILPHIIISDLDGDIEKILEANKIGSFILIHAHGDNIIQIKKYALNFNNVLGTVQLEPFGKLKNFGGFTDGDRCVFLADHFQAKKIFLFGFDFGNIVGKFSKPGKDKNYKANYIKRKKLEIAESLINYLKMHSKTIIANCTNRV